MYPCCEVKHFAIYQTKYTGTENLMTKSIFRNAVSAYHHFRVNTTANSSACTAQHHRSLTVRTGKQWAQSNGVDSRGGARGRLLPPKKIYLGESIFSPRQSFTWTAKKLHQEGNTNRHLKIQTQKTFWGGGFAPSAASPYPSPVRTRTPLPTLHPLGASLAPPQKK